MMPSAAFQGRAFIKSMHSMKEEADAVLLCTLLPSSWHMVDGLKKKMDLNGVKIYSSCITGNKLFLSGHMLHVVLAVPAYAVMKECFRLIGCTDQTTLCADPLHHTDWKFSLHFFLSDSTCTFNERNSTLIYDYKRLENAV